GPRYVLIKGGHLKGDATDLLWNGREFTRFTTARIDSKNTHGTGCTFSAAITAGLARGQALGDALRSAESHRTPRHRLPFLRRVPRGAAPRPGPGRRHPLREGLRDARNPRGLQGRTRRGPAPALHPRLVMSDSEPIASDAPAPDEAGKMSFFDHLTELRTPLIWSLI